MGKTKIHIIDDSAPVEKKQDKPHKKINPSPEELEAAKEKNLLPDKGHSVAGQSITEKQKTENRKLTQKPGKRTKIRSKKYQEALRKVDRNKNYPLEEAINLARETSYSKYPGTLEIHISTNVKNLRGLVSLPFSSGKKLTILAFGKNAKDSGADIEGDDETIEQIVKGKINFDVLVTTPEWMSKLAGVAKYLGPRGLMPNPKNGTITNDLKKTVTEFQSGKVEYKTEKEVPVIHMSLGKIKQPNQELIANFKALSGVIGKTKVKKIILSPTLGPGIKVDLDGI